jgi:spermidine synthase
MGKKKKRRKLQQHQKKDVIKAVTAQGTEQSSPFILALVLACFFISGLTGLTYEILWTRMIVEIIGSAPFAISIVLTVFMGGLGLGSYLAGRSIDRVRNPLRLVGLYGLLELIVGAYGILLPLFLILFKPLYGVLYNRLFEYFYVYQILTFAGCFILLIIPVTCMGATLPILSRFFVTRLSTLGTHVGRLYGLNTIGAAVGSVLCGFWLINHLGVWGSLIFAIVLNAIIGLVCIVLSRTLATPLDKAGQNKKVIKTSPAASEVPAEAPEKGVVEGWHALIIFGISGFCAMAYEVVWTKLLGLLVGPTTYSFTIVLVAFITGLALGSIFFGWLGDRVKNVMGLLLMTQVAAALFSLLSSQIMGNSQIFFAKLIYHFKDHFALLSLVKAAVLFIFMFFPTFCLGATFPLVGKIYTRSLARTGRSIGSAYAVNSVGAVLGSFSAGFLLIPLVGKERGLSLVVAIQLLTALVIITHRAVKKWAPHWKQSAIAVPALIGVLLIGFYPQWDRKMLSTGKYHRFFKEDIKDLGWFSSLFSGTGRFRNPDNRLLYFGDGIGGFTTVLDMGVDILGNRSLNLFNSGKADASTRGDMQTQTLSAHFPMLFHPNPKSVLVVGLASGITAGEMLHYPLESLDVVEINDKVIAASDFFVPWNNQVLSSPKTNLFIQDGRAHLALTKKNYDVISSEPSNPWMAGLAALFTQEFFRLAKDRLNEGGIFVQFIHTYQMDWSTFALVGRTFASVFPNSLLVRTDPSGLGADFLLVGINGDERPQENVAARNLAYAGKSDNVTFLDHRILYHLIVSEDLKALFGEGRVNTDHRPWLEYSAPRLIHVEDESIGRKIRERRAVYPRTKAIIRESKEDVGWQMDYVAYGLSLYRTGILPRHPVDLDRATSNQRERLAELIEAYCAANLVSDFSYLKDEALRNRCIAVQIEAARKKIDTSPYKGELLFHMATLSLKKGDIDEAVRAYTRGLALKPNMVGAHINLGFALGKLGRENEAKAHFEKALKIAPQNPEAHYNLGDFYYQSGKMEQALEHFGQVLSIDPKHVKTLFVLGGLMAQQGKLESALKYYEEALALAPKSILGHYNMACVLARQRETVRAVESLRKAIEVGFDDWDHLMTDPDLENIRHARAYQELISQHEK